MWCVSERARKARAGRQERGRDEDVQPELCRTENKGAEGASEPRRRGRRHPPSDSLPKQQQVLSNVLREPSVLNP